MLAFQEASLSFSLVILSRLKGSFDIKDTLLLAAVSAGDTRSGEDVRV